jgi:Fibronectin type III domain
MNKWSLCFLLALGLTACPAPVTPPTDTQKPTAPTALTVSAKTTSSLTLTWSASTDDVGVTGYDVLEGTTVKKSVTTLTAVVDGLTPDTSYTFTVRAKDAANNLSDSSASVTDKTDAGVPVGCEPVTGNLLENSGLENTPLVWIDNSTPDKPEAGGGAIDGGHCGAKALEIPKEGGLWRQNIDASKLSAGTYTVTLWWKGTTATAKCNVVRGFTNSDFEKLGGADGTVVGTDWVKFTADFDIPAGIGYFSVYLWNFSYGQTPTPSCLFDDISIAKKL